MLELLSINFYWLLNRPAPKIFTIVHRKFSSWKHATRKEKERGHFSNEFVSWKNETFVNFHNSRMLLLIYKMYLYRPRYCILKMLIWKSAKSPFIKLTICQTIGSSNHFFYQIHNLLNWFVEWHFYRISWITKKIII